MLNRAVRALVIFGVVAATSLAAVVRRRTVLEPSGCGGPATSGTVCNTLSRSPLTMSTSFGHNPTSRQISS
jgi:hypothetical protein